MRKICLILCFVVLINSCIFANDLKNSLEPKVSSNGAVLIDFETGRVLWGKNETKKMPMASTTKIMTAILALESGKLDEVAKVSKKAQNAPKVKLNVLVDEEYKLEDLLYPLMLQSSNDVAIVIAEHVSGSVEEFCKDMTKKAKEIGALNTIFETPNGLDSANHYSTAYDMALITKYAMQNVKFVELINTNNITIQSKKGRIHNIYNKNRLLKEFDGANGVKTGYTNNAGHCFVGSAKRDEKAFISVVLASGWGNVGKEQKWKDTKSILNFAFLNYNKTLLAKTGDVFGEIDVLHSKELKVSLEVDNTIYAMLNEDEQKNLQMKISLPTFLEAPIYEGDIIGFAEIFVNDEESCGKIDIVATSTALRHDFFTSLKKMIDCFLNLGGYLFG